MSSAVCTGRNNKKKTFLFDFKITAAQNGVNIDY